MCGNNFQIYGAFIPIKRIDLRHFYSCPSPLKTRPPSSLSRTRQKETTHSFKEDPLKDLFPPAAEKCRENYDLFYQNSVRKYEDDLVH